MWRADVGVPMRRKVPQKLACRMGMGKSGGAKLKAGARTGTVTTAKDELLLWNQTAPKFLQNRKMRASRLVRDERGCVFLDLSMPFTPTVRSIRRYPAPRGSGPSRTH